MNVGRWRAWLGLVTLGALSFARADDLHPGQPAPAFALPDQQGKVHRLDDYRGQWVVLYFYPKDDTPGCTKEACRLRDDITALRALHVQVIGVSLDSTDSHARFARKHALPFPLLSDAEGKTADAYGALWSLGPIRFARRHTFVIDPQGRVAKIYRQVEPDRHSAQLVTDVRSLQALAAGP
jgi:peroxiredoxin Q/BCP